MTLEILRADMITALKEQNKTKKDILADLIGAVKKAGIDKGYHDEIPEEVVNDALLKELKIAEEQVATCPAARTDLLEKYKGKIAIIKVYAPILITDPEVVKAMIRENISGDQLKQHRGLVMKALKGRVDMRVANQVFNSMLS